MRVIFRKWRKGGEIIAYFLDCPEGRGTIQSYMHIGQHGAATYPNTDTVPAVPDEYALLWLELRSIGYTNLRPVVRGRPTKEDNAP